MINPLISGHKEQIRELIESEPSIGIVIGENQNLDLLAAGLGFYLVLKSAGKNVQIVSRKGTIVEFSNLFGVDQIAKSFGGKAKVLTISVPYNEGEIDKVSYNIEADRLNVNLFAEEKGINFNEADIEYIKKGSSPSLVITIGVSNESEMNGLVDLKSVKTIHIDKNPLNSLFGDVSIVDPSFSSVSEIVAELIKDLELGHDADAFQNLLNGITYATRNFSASNTSASAFDAAGFLLQNGARRQDVPGGQKDARNFPREEYFLNQKQKPFQNQPQEKFEEIEKNQETQPDIPAEVPNDWFLPKVFKGSKKGN
ncbi:MAG: hypothetical protein A3E68_02700 [Candidatus Levybacteria bacterium RIFCSPHIGHO2_12_FULL_39_39]|nr:MAG: DHH family phosphoesterase [Candidatus Levybacteria bacterium GW2011_GWA1_39_11]KKR24787.1 MAG: DHH family phosphoesterase [Candidatus Levybacteria bacterium GW2011_GWB1_39_7]OGH15575.1 MAG: hypothetical protein A2689_03160 [Candidatus Levybacteria bacterium RIFCSPHIGHO2_01_FULL_38_96]OGH25537.1 MAG: hypothetical protein A3E68_02700 [Candidatus Levybacteria bacterium RIFCSPHIGHO2_12_FULL_39_39]